MHLSSVSLHGALHSFFSFVTILIKSFYLLAALFYYFGVLSFNFASLV